MKKILLTLLLLVSVGIAASAETWSYALTKSGTKFDYTSRDFSGVVIGQTSPIKFNVGTSNEMTWNILINAIDNNNKPTLSNDGTGEGSLTIGAAAKPPKDITLSSANNFEGMIIKSFTIKVAGGAKIANYTASLNVGDFKGNDETISGSTATELTWTPNCAGEISVTFKNNITEVGKSKNAGIKIISFSVEYEPDLSPRVTDLTTTVKQNRVTGWMLVSYKFNVANYDDVKPVVEMVVYADGVKVTEGIEFSVFQPSTTTNAPALAAAENTAFDSNVKATGEIFKDANKKFTADLNVTVGGKTTSVKGLAVEEQVTTGIEDVTVDENAPAEFFTLQGVRVSEPQAGQLYIKRQGGKATKVFVK